MTTTPTEFLAAVDAADNFRVQVGRYGERWYTDPLPACPIANACEDNWPSVSTVKKASGSDWSFVALKRVADEMTANPARFAGLDEANLYETLKVVNRTGLDKAARRGTSVHTMCETLLRGEKITNVGAAGEYRAAVEAFFDTYQPEPLAVEAVCIHRDLNGRGYGGTGDAGLRIAGKLYKVDWKSRGVDSKHGAYPEEAAQVAAYARAQYMIVTGPDGQSLRELLPVYDGGLIISIKPDGARVYPVDLDKGFKHWEQLHAWWVARRSEREPISRSWQVKAPSKAVVSPDSPCVKAQPHDEPDADLLRARVQRIVDAGHGSDLAAIWLPDLPTLRHEGHSIDQLVTIERLCCEVEKQHGMSFDPDQCRLQNLDRIKRMLEPFDSEERDALLNEVSAVPINVWTLDQINKLNVLLSAIDRLTVAFSYEGDRPRLIKQKPPKKQGAKK